MGRTIFLICVAATALGTGLLADSGPAGASGEVVAQTTSSGSSSKASKPLKRTRRQVEALIKEAGKTPPEWWDSVELDYPKTLLLAWPKPAKGEKWQPRKYPGQYVISVAGPNPGRWKATIKLMHHILEINKDNPEARKNAINQLGNMYYNYTRDYARAAFWLRKGSQWGRIKLVSCYWKLGCRSMASSALRKMGADRTRNCSQVRLWSEMGDLKRAVSMAETSAKRGWADAAYLAAGDVCRQHGKFDTAVKYYEKALKVTKGGRDIKRNKERARAGLEAVKVFDKLNLAKISDGTYSGSAQGYRGPVTVQVVIKGGRIESCRVTQHREDLAFNAMTVVPQQIVEAQGVKGVDAISSATVSCSSIINATAKALASGMN